MSLIKFVTEIIPKKTQVLVTHSNSLLAVEILRQLSLHSYIDSIPCSDPSAQLPLSESLGVVIHLPGFGSPSLSETLSHTTALYRLLNLALSHNAKFFLIIPNSRSPLYHTAVTLVTQFAKNFSLSYSILEVDKTAPLSQTASEIITKFIYGHRPQDGHSPHDRHSQPTGRRPPPTIPLPSPHHPKPAWSALPLPARLKKILLVLLTIFFALWLIFVLSVISALAFFSCSQTSLSKYQLLRSLKCANYSLFSSSLAVSLTRLLPGSAPALLSLGFPPSPTLSALESYSRVLSSLTSLSSQSRKLISFVFTSSSSPTRPVQLLPYLSQSSETLAQLQTDLRAFYIASPRPQQAVASLSRRVQSLHSSVSKAQFLLADLDRLFAPEKKSSVVILVQDNTELRPTGGLIDTLVLLNLDQGRLISAQVTSVTSADKELTGQADAPADFRAVTGNTTWLLRDSNWDPDFPTTAKRAAWFIDKELSTSPDVVIAINLSLLTDILSVLGPVTLDNPPLTFTSPTFTSQYLDYLRTYPDHPSPLPEIIRALLSKISQLTPLQIDQLQAAFISSLESGQSPVSTSTFPSSLVTTSWGRGVSLPVCDSLSPCLSDYFLPAIFNTATNKSDAFISTSTSFAVNFERDRLSKTITYQLRHTGLTSDWPSGPHHAYLRFYLPLLTKLDLISLNGDSLSSDRYSLTTSHGLMVVGLQVGTTPASTTRIQLRTSQPLNFKGQFHYQLVLPGHPGLSSPPDLNLIVTYPQPWFVSTYLTPSVAIPGRLEYNTATGGFFRLNLDLTPAQ